MTKKNTLKLWTIWVLASILLVLIFAYQLLGNGVSKAIFMPGDLSMGHHQLEDACESCHTDAFGGGEVLQEACINCHGDQRIKPFDSHPRSKFKDPRNASRLEKINALMCTSCHVEHKPEITQKDGLTQPIDVCFHCHADIGEERPSHVGMEFTTCKNSGCHNFHNNRALYTDFLVKHMDAPMHMPNPHLPETEFVSVLEEILEYPHDSYPVQTLQSNDADAPEVSNKDESIHRDWLETAHANAGVNCSACHQTRNEENELSTWNDHPGMESCQTCHGTEVERFKLGKHGMRLAVGLSPMMPKDAKLPMNKNAAHEELTCTSCHGAHRFDTTVAAVESCLECHADEHSLAYKDSPHFSLWQQQIVTNGSSDSGVSCASCHMPRVEYDVNDWLTRVMVDHNQSASLSPNSKMIRSSCIHCHGLGFSIGALADQELIENNFNGKPSVHVESIDLARKDNEKYLQKMNK
ncbi:MAG: cytochrome c3 family protein [Pseudomonadota bacterium]